MRSFCGSAALVAALFLGACQRSSDTAAPKATLLVPASDPVAVLLQGDQLIIANRGAEPIRYAVIERTHFETALAPSFGLPRTLSVQDYAARPLG